jgi:hypothetical protein
VVFVSHASKDSGYANEVVHFLEEAKLPCWIAPRDIPAGQTWAGAIVDGIQRSRLLVVLLTERSCASPEVHREVELASRANKHMLTVRLDTRAQLAGPLEFFLSSIQWIDATARPLVPQLHPLPVAVGTLLGIPVVPQRAPGDKRRDRDSGDGRPVISLDDLLKRGRR